MNSKQLEHFLYLHLQKCLPHHPIAEVFHYSTLPAGKLFRPKLVWAVLSDLSPNLYDSSKFDPYSAHALLASAIELHHAYTLIHDDLPCMDNDIMRRGRSCTHIKYGEWKALLAGDGLLNVSYQLLSNIKNQRLLELFKLFSWALGPKGLIHGQVLDLSHEMTQDFESLIRTHELKTGRLIQVAILGSALLAQAKNRDMERKLWKFSLLLGINFQLLDDLSELTEKNINRHEKEINTWINNFESTFNYTEKSLKKFNQIAIELNLSRTNQIITEYYSKMIENLINHKNLIEKHIPLTGANISPLILLLKRFSER